MRRYFLKLVATVVLAGLASGCSTYMIDRGRDAADIFTVAAGLGGGVRVRVGPLHAGLFCGIEWIGVQAGAWRQANPMDGPEGSGTVDLTFAFLDGSDAGFDPTIRERGKTYEVHNLYPFIAVLPRSWEQPLPVHPYNTQIEVAGGLLGTLRLGFNPGELLDFILGWAGIDIYNDDLEARKEREEEEP